jgi:Na+-translocating ferredoxin:NAD+ oxidoreductase subunit B
MPSSSLSDRIDALLPQTQCGKCGYQGCRPYAQAIADGLAPINRCPPGGQDGIRAIAALLQTAEIPLDTRRGQHLPLMVATIDESHCIGCTLCIQACPVDAIVGASKLMHTVIADQCTGCDLCVAACPVDCITMKPADHAWTSAHAALARSNYQNRQTRLRARHDEASALAAKTLSNKAPLSAAAHGDAAAKQRIIAGALARARARRQSEAS